MEFSERTDFRYTQGCCASVTVRRHFKARGTATIALAIRSWKAKRAVIVLLRTRDGGNVVKNEGRSESLLPTEAECLRLRAECQERGAKQQTVCACRGGGAWRDGDRSEQRRRGAGPRYGRELRGPGRLHGHQHRPERHRGKRRGLVRYRDHGFSPWDRNDTCRRCSRTAGSIRSDRRLQ